MQKVPLVCVVPSLLLLFKSKGGKCTLFLAKGNCNSAVLSSNNKKRYICHSLSVFVSKQ